MTYDKRAMHGTNSRPAGARTAALVQTLAEERTRRRLKQRELVEMLGGAWAQPAISGVLGGTLAPSVELLAHLAEALGYRLILERVESEPDTSGT